MADTARQAAFYVLNELDESDRTVDAILETAFEKYTGLKARDRALAYRIVYGVLRWRNRIDWMIGQISTRPAGNIDARVMNILRIAVCQMEHLDRIPDSAAVNESVKLAKQFASPGTASFVNGVLRNLIRKKDRLKFPSPHKNPAEYVSVEGSHPLWLVKRWLDRFGWEQTTSLCQTNNRIPDMILRTNTLLVDRQTLLSELNRMGFSAKETDRSPDGIRLGEFSFALFESLPCKKGWFQVQDTGAQLVTLLLSPKPGETVLDACAGRGGKTGHIAQVMENAGNIVALDNNRQRLDQLETEMKRLRVNCVTPRSGDLLKTAPDDFTALFDQILLDAPCSALGVLGRNPDTRWCRQKNDLERFQQKQLALLDSAANLLKAGGVLVYAVCSMEPEENEEVVETFLHSRPDFEKETSPDALHPKVSPFVGTSGYFKTFPHLHGMDGFFGARLKRQKDGEKAGAF